MLWRRRLPGAPAAAGVIGRGEEDIFFCRQKATVFRVELARTATGRGEKKDTRKIKERKQENKKKIRIR